VWGVWLEGAVWFGTNPSSTKGRNIARDPRIVVHLESGDDVVILEGAVELPETLPEGVAAAYEEKYGHRVERLFALRPRVAHTWTERDFARNATRWVFTQA
jgi:hypothetical protein